MQPIRAATKTPDGKPSKQRPSSSAPLSRTADHPLSQLQAQLGNRGINLWLQAMPQFGHSGDIYEQEADLLAERIITLTPGHPESVSISSHSTPMIQSVQEKPTPSGAHADASISVTREGGEPLPQGYRAYYEQRFGRDFGDVRVHYNTVSAESARAIRARAYTVGRDIFFAEGEYSPGNEAGRKLLAHELTHVVQQEANKRSQNMVQRQEESMSPPTAAHCNSVRIELPDRIHFNGDGGRVVANVSTTIPPGDYWITYSPAAGSFVVGAIGYNPAAPPELNVISPSNPGLFEEYRQSVTREGVRLHVVSIPEASITAAYAQDLSCDDLAFYAEAYRSRLANLEEGVEYFAIQSNLEIIQSEQLRRQASQLRIIGEIARPPGLPAEGGYALQPAPDLPADIVAAIPEGQLITWPPQPMATGMSYAGAGVQQPSPNVVVIEALDANLQPLAAPLIPEETFGVRPTDITSPLAGGGLGMTRSINAALLQTGFKAAGADAIGLVGIPRWFTPGAMVPESLLDQWGHTAVYVRRAGQIEVVRGFNPRMGMELLINARAVERGAHAVPAAIGSDAYLFTMTGARSIEFPVSASVAESLVQRLPVAGPVQPGVGVPTLYSARPAVYRICTASNCVLWAADVAEEALGGVIGPAGRGVSVTALAEGGAVVEATASQGRLIGFMRSVASGEEAAAAVPQATGPAVASSMPRGLQVLKWGGRVFFVIGLATVPLETALAPPGEKARTAVGAGAGFLGGLAGGAAAGLACGPGAPVCSIVLGLVFGIAGALGARSLAEKLYDVTVLLAEHPEALIAPPMATTLVFRGGYGGLLENPLTFSRRMQMSRRR